MSKHTKEDLKKMAQTIMFNPNSNRSNEVIWALAVRQGITPQDALNQINRLANS